LGLRLGEQFAHRLNAGAEFDDPLVGELGRRGLSRGKPSGVQVSGWGRLPGDEDREPRDGEADDEAESDEEGGFHGSFFTRFVRVRWAAAPVRPDSSTGTNREHIDRAKSSPYIASQRCAMAVRDILILPDKRLRLVSKPVAKIDAATRRLVEDMFDTMYDAPGIGLAAIQIGEARRIVTMDLAKKDDPKEPQVFINPELVGTSGDKNIHEEGCLSIPEYYEEVERPAQVMLRYLDLDGKQHEVEATGLLATCIQHEIDHLDGVLFIDHISKLKRDRVIKKYTKAAKLGKAPGARAAE
jgi:peptide deformylase